jgi:hypothetical protein
MRETNEQGQSQELLNEKYPERPHLTRIPYGYIKKAGDPNLLVPDPAVIPLLDQALDQLDAGISLRTVTEWLNANTPEYAQLSHSGLVKLRKFYRPNAKVKKAPIKRLTPDEKAAKKRRMLIAQEKKKIKNAQKRAARLGEELTIIKENTIDAKDRSLLMELDYSSPEYKEIEQEEIPVVFKPNPGPQTLFFAAEELEVLYGGAAGGGKSYALIADPMRYFDNKHFRGLILRRTNDELRELIWKSQELYPQIWDKAQWREKDKEWRFPSGARLWMTYLERDEDVMRYHGQAFTYIGIDELTQYSTPFAWNFMRSRLRDASGTLPLFMRATTNPGGPGHGWVKRMFVDPAPKGKAFWATDIDSGETLTFPKDHPKSGQPLFKRRFIPARVSDNPYIWADGNYEANLMSLPEVQRKQLLEGDWSVADGAAFSEFNERVHTCEPFEVPAGWRKFRSCDFGYSTFSAVHWYAIDPEDVLYVYRELYVSKKTGKELARLILDLEKNEKVTYGVLDSSVWAQRGQTGPSIAEEMIAEGCRWRPSDRTAGSRINGKNRLHELLKVNKYTNRPGIIFFNTCRQIIADLPMIPMDPKGGEDIDDRYLSDHAYDSIRYGIMTRPRGNEVMSLQNYKVTHWMPSDPTFGY